MREAEVTQLRGFDSYPVSLGDEMRGLRASMGKSLLDVQRDLRIKAAHIAALENADPSAVPHRGYLKGYLRAYARYLGMDESEVLRRFREESGLDLSPGPVAPRGGGAARAPAFGRRDDLDAAIAGSRLAAVSRAQSVNGELGATLRGLGSVAALGLLVWGLGYGGWAVLQNIQRVEFAPQPSAPGAVADSPDIGTFARIAHARAAAPAVDAEALAAVYAAQVAPPPAPSLRDGPISAIDPAEAGVFARTARPAAPRRPPQVAGGAFPPAPPEDLLPAEANLAAVARTAPSAEETAPPPLPTPTGLALVFPEEAWVRVRDAEGAVIHEALMGPGSVWRAPEGAEGLTLRAGNAGGVFVEIDGALFGPLGGAGGVVSGVELDPAALAERLPSAEATDALVEAAMAASLVEGGAARP